MRICFSIHYESSFGEDLFISGPQAALGANDPKQAFPLKYITNGLWQAEILLPENNPLLSYNYFIRQANGKLLHESGPQRRILLSNKTKTLCLQDQWQGNNDYSPFLSSPFTDVFFARPKAKEQATHAFSRELIIRAVMPNLPEDTDIYISGNQKELGLWDPAKALQLQLVFGAIWEVRLSAGKLESPIEYKFLMKQAGAHKLFVWESGVNRTLALPPMQLHQSYLAEHAILRFPISRPRFAGTAVPVFALRSNESSGIGDFNDLRLMTDWAAQTHQRVLQLLPLNDTTMTHTWTDSYPYGAISIMALHPLYLHEQSMGQIQDKKIADKLAKRRKKLNEQEQIDYPAVAQYKWAYFRSIFEQNGAADLNTPEYLDFFTQNRFWLLSYAAFCLLRDQYKSADFNTWGSYALYRAEAIEPLCAPQSKHIQEIQLHYYIQYHLHKQLLAAKTYAHEKGIILKGDIPIGITPHSVEAWTEPHYFHIDGQAGAPPDDFSIKGQNWGFPTYNWDRMAQDGYAWWKRRFQKMAEYFDAYRMDHVLGFFRIWEIPQGQIEGLLGHFSPALPLSEHAIHGYGFHFSHYRDAQPYIREFILDELFGHIKEEIIEVFFDPSPYGTYTFKQEYNTQQKIAVYFSDKSNPESADVQERLILLAADQLFLPDPLQQDMYHPRISAQYTYSYRALEPEQQTAFNRLYDEFFYHRHNQFWEAEALKKLPELIHSTGMLACAEDLGMIPACVPHCLRQLHILSLEIQRMPKDPSQRFAHPKSYSYLSVCTTGTHDTSTLRGWWEEDYETSSQYYAQILHEHGVAPYFCEPWLCARILQKHLASPSMLAIFPLQDWLAISPALRRQDPEEERINVPSNPQHYWRYRMHINIEELLEQHELNEHIALMIRQSGR